MVPYDVAMPNGKKVSTARIGAKFKELREELGLSVRDAAQKAGWGDGSIWSKRETGETRISEHDRRVMAAALGLTIEQFDAKWRSQEIHRTQGAHGIPVINRAPAGVIVNYEEYGVDSGQGFEYIDWGDVEDKMAYALIVVGDSMEPALYDGDKVVLSPQRHDSTAAKIVNGSVVFARFRTESKHDGCLLARWFERDGVITLSKDNRKYPAVVCQREDLEQLAAVIERRTVRLS